MKEVPLSAQLRDGVGKGPARQARMEGAVPAVLYGPEVDPKPIKVNAKELRKAFKEAAGTTAIFALDVAGKENKAIIREIVLSETYQLAVVEQVANQATDPGNVWLWRSAWSKRHCSM